MARTKTVSSNFDQGSISDIPRSQLRDGAAYRILDYIPSHIGASLRKRGGYRWRTPTLTSISAAANVRGMTWAPFAAGPVLVVSADNGKVYTFNAFDGVSGGTFIGTGPVVDLNPTWHVDRVVFTPKFGVNASPQKLLSGALSVVGGTPPHAAVAASWLGAYLIFANGYAKHSSQGTVDVRYPNRAWYSPPGNPELWTTANSFFDLPEEIFAVVARGNMQMFFGSTGVHVITGDIPPPGGNLALREFQFNEGTFDGRTVVRYKDFVVWANSSGIWRSDGSTLTSLTDQSGFSHHYRDMVKDFDTAAGWEAAAGMYQGHYMLSITDPMGVTMTTFIRSMDEAHFFEFQNIDAACYAARPGGVGEEELFIGHQSLDRIFGTSAMWEPSSTNTADAEGTVVEPVLETAYYRLDSDVLKRIRRAYLTYDLDAAAEATRLHVESLLDPLGAYEMDAHFEGTTELTRRAIDIKRKTLGVALRISQDGPSNDTRISRIELEGHLLEESR